jgi:LPS-assembly lipoprotein
MWLSKRRFLTLLAGLPLAACGFEPVYGPEGAATALRGRIAYRAPETPEGFRLRARLEDRLGRVERGDYLLLIGIETREEAVVISSDQDINRYNLPGRATWALFSAEDLDADTPLASGEVRTFTAYSAFGSTVATQEAQDDARDRLAVALADLIVTDLVFAAQDLP